MMLMLMLMLMLMVVVVVVEVVIRETLSVSSYSSGDGSTAEHSFIRCQSRADAATLSLSFSY